MNERLYNAARELKRVDHLIYVSLKYTRTVDVLISVLERLINSFDFIIDCLLERLKEKKRIKDYPKSPGLKCDILKEKISKDEKLMEMIDFYLLLRKLVRSEYTKKEEYKRHVTMIVNIDGKDIDVSIDVVTDYYKKSKEYIEYIDTLVGGK